jgi:hypothetical protein
VTGSGRPARRTGGDLPEDVAGGPPGPFEVVAGHPSAEDLAALAVVLSAVLARPGAGAGTGAAERTHSGWADRSRLLGAPPRPGPDAWRRSARPG